MKKRLFSLLLFSVFLIGCLGHLYFRPRAVEEFPYRLTFFSKNVNNLLLHEVPKEGKTLTVAGAEAVVLRTFSTPATLSARQRGETLHRPSSLSSDVTFTLKAYGHEHDGCFYLGTQLLSFGACVVLKGQNFALSACFTGAKAGF